MIRLPKLKALCIGNINAKWLIGPYFAIKLPPTVPHFDQKSSSQCYVEYVTTQIEVSGFIFQSLSSTLCVYCIPKY